jgi:hypothetical protein
VLVVVNDASLCNMEDGEEEDNDDGGSWLESGDGCVCVASDPCKTPRSRLAVALRGGCCGPSFTTKASTVISLKLTHKATTATRNSVLLDRFAMAMIKQAVSEVQKWFTNKTRRLCCSRTLVLAQMRPCNNSGKAVFLCFLRRTNVMGDVHQSM